MQNSLSNPSNPYVDPNTEKNTPLFLPDWFQPFLGRSIHKHNQVFTSFESCLGCNRWNNHHFRFQEIQHVLTTFTDKYCQKKIPYIYEESGLQETKQVFTIVNSQNSQLAYTHTTATQPPQALYSLFHPLVLSLSAWGIITNKSCENANTITTVTWRGVRWNCHTTAKTPPTAPCRSISCISMAVCCCSPGQLRQRVQDVRITFLQDVLNNIYARMANSLQDIKKSDIDQQKHIVDQRPFTQKNWISLIQTLLS